MIKYVPLSKDNALKAREQTKFTTSSTKSYLLGNNNSLNKLLIEIVSRLSFHPEPIWIH